MRVLFLSKSYPVYGGVERWLALLCEYLGNLGIEPVVALAKGAKFHCPDTYQRAYPMLTTMTLDGSSGSRAACSHAVQKAIDRTKPAVVVPVMLYDGLSGAVEYKKKRGYPRIVYPVHEHRPEPIQDIRNFGSNLDMIVCADQLSRNAVATCTHFPESRLSVIPQGVETPNATRRVDNNSIARIGFAGRLQEGPKRILDLVEIWRELARAKLEFSLRIAGTGPDEVEIRRQLDPWVGSDQVTFLGNLDSRRMQEEFYPELDMLLVTSRTETGPLVAWEALRYGVAVVTSRYQGLEAAGFFMDGVNSMIYDVGDTRAASKAIVRLATNQRLRTELANRGRMDATTKRSAEAFIQSWSDLLVRVVSDPIHLERLSPMPRQQYRSRLEALGISIKFAERARKFFDVSFNHQSVRSEWPFYSTVSEETTREYSEEISVLDRRTNDHCSSG